jgi:hypothetical protein
MTMVTQASAGTRGNTCLTAGDCGIVGEGMARPRRLLAAATFAARLDPRRFLCTASPVQNRHASYAKYAILFNILEKRKAILVALSPNFDHVILC